MFEFLLLLFCLLADGEEFVDVRSNIFVHYTQNQFIHATILFFSTYFFYLFFAFFCVIMTPLFTIR